MRKCVLCLSRGPAPDLRVRRDQKGSVVTAMRRDQKDFFGQLLSRAQVHRCNRAALRLCDGAIAHDRDITARN